MKKNIWKLIIKNIIQTILYSISGSKGVIIDGRLCMDSWEKDGKKETKIYVKAQDVRFSNVGSVKSEDSENKPQQEKSTKKAQLTPENDGEFSDVPF